MRILKLVRTIVDGKDAGSAMLLGLIAVVVVWLAGMLFTTTIPRLALERFHLQTGSFFGWSMQQIIPAMYNFENQSEFVADRPVSPAVLAYATGDHQMNHFPVRSVTFFECRYRLFNEGNGADLTLVSRYRNQRIITRWKVDAAENGLTLKLVNKQLDQNFAP